MHSMIEQLSDVVILEVRILMVGNVYIYIYTYILFPNKSLLVPSWESCIHQYLVIDIHLKQVMQAPEDVEEDDFRMLFEQMERLEPQSLRIYSVWIALRVEWMALTKEVAWQEVILPWSPRTGITSLVLV